MQEKKKLHTCDTCVSKTRPSQRWRDTRACKNGSNSRKSQRQLPLAVTATPGTCTLLHSQERECDRIHSDADEIIKTIRPRLVRPRPSHVNASAIPLPNEGSRLRAPQCIPRHPQRGQSRRCRGYQLVRRYQALCFAQLEMGLGVGMGARGGKGRSEGRVVWR